MIRRSRRAVVVWAAVLVGARLVIGVILAVDRWPFTNIRIALLVIFGVELVLAVAGGVTSAWVHPGAGPATGLYGFMRPSAMYIDDLARQRETESWSAGRLDPIAIGPALALALLLISFALIS